MEVTKNNYSSLEGRIIEEIKNCDFISFDLELTGIIPSQQYYLSLPEERYSICKTWAERFTIIQLGLTIWKKIENNSYECRPYNFYVFPYEEFNNNNFKMELGSIIFNRNNNVDFNKWIYGGVPYLNTEQANKLADRLINEDINYYTPEDSNHIKKITLYKKGDINIYEDFCKKFDLFINNPDEKELTYPKLARHILYYFINNLDIKNRENIYIDKDESEANTIIKKINKDVKFIEMNKKREQSKKKIIGAKGVKNLFEKIEEYKKVMVGHNCFVDLLFICTHFGNGLPEEYTTFKTRVLNEFKGGIYDTKYLFLNYNTQNNGLDEIKIHLEGMTKLLLEKHKNDIKINIPFNKDNENEQFENYFDSLTCNENEEEIKKTNQKFHFADYDAFTTGLSFLYMKLEYGDDFVLNNVFKLNPYNSVFRVFNFKGDDVLIGNNAVLYCLIPNPNKNIDIFDFINDNYKNYVKKTKLEQRFNENVIGILAEFNSINEKKEFENEMTSHKDDFQFLLYEQYLLKLNYQKKIPSKNFFKK